MTNTTEPTADSHSQQELSDDLPPVQPPSAAFIFQLFVVPGLIVLAVVVVWFAFGRIAAYDQDPGPLAADLQSSNNKIRDRAMYGLAELLVRDSRRGEAGQHLASNTEVAKALTDKLAQELKSGSTSEESVGVQVYLTRAVGYLDTADLAMPVLREALSPTRDLEVRKGGALSIAMIAGRAFEAGRPLDDPETVDALIELSADSQKLMRQTAAFALAFFQSERADQQLHVLLGNADQATSINAAIALARRNNTDGLGVFKQALMTPTPEKQEDVFEHFTILTNTLKAIVKLAPAMSDADRAEFRDVLTPLTTNHAEIRIRVDAQNALQSLK